MEAILWSLEYTDPSTITAGALKVVNRQRQKLWNGRKHRERADKIPDRPAAPHSFNTGLEEESHSIQFLDHINISITFGRAEEGNTLLLKSIRIKGLFTFILTSLNKQVVGINSQ